jgi:dihydroorotate dehydrogenase
MSLLRASARPLRSLHSAATTSRRTITSSTTSRNPVRTGLYAAAFTVATGALAVYYFDSRSALHRYVLTPAIRNALDAETGQKIAVKVLRSGLGPKDPVADQEVLKAEVRQPDLFKV